MVRLGRGTAFGPVRGRRRDKLSAPASPTAAVLFLRKSRRFIVSSLSVSCRFRLWLSPLYSFGFSGQNGDFRHADAVVAAGLAHGREAEEPRRDRREADFLRDGVVADVPEAALVDIGRPGLPVFAGLEAVGIDRAAAGSRPSPSAASAPACSAFAPRRAAGCNITRRSSGDCPYRPSGNAATESRWTAMRLTDRRRSRGRHCRPRRVRDCPRRSPSSRSAHCPRIASRLSFLNVRLHPRTQH